jgi:hypothetical protein
VGCFGLVRMTIGGLTTLRLEGLCRSRMRRAVGARGGLFVLELLPAIRSRDIGAGGREWRRRLRRQPERANSSIRLTVLYSQAKTRKCRMSGFQAIGILGDVPLRNHSVAGDVAGGCA